MRRSGPRNFLKVLSTGFCGSGYRLIGAPAFRDSSILTSRPTEQTQSEWLVGEGRFELPTSSSRTKRANQAALLPEEGKTTKPLAEGEGFEPPEPCGSADFESAALDQTMRPLRRQLYTVALLAAASSSRNDPLMMMLFYPNAGHQAQRTFGCLRQEMPRSARWFWAWL